jgi:hypothetical protein
VEYRELTHKCRRLLGPPRAAVAFSHASTDISVVLWPSLCTAQEEKKKAVVVVAAAAVVVRPCYVRLRAVRVARAVTVRRCVTVSVRVRVCRIVGADRHSRRHSHGRVGVRRELGGGGGGPPGCACGERGDHLRQRLQRGWRAAHQRCAAIAASATVSPFLSPSSACVRVSGAEPAVVSLRRPPAPPPPTHTHTHLVAGSSTGRIAVTDVSTMTRAKGDG